MRLTEEVNVAADGGLTVTISAVPGRPSSYQSGLRLFLEWFLGESLESYVLRKRATDPPRTFRGIAEDMSRDVEAAAERLNPDGPKLRIAISHNLPTRVAEEADGS